MTNTYINRLHAGLSLAQPTGSWTNGFGYDLPGEIHVDGAEDLHFRFFHSIPSGDDAGRYLMGQAKQPSLVRAGNGFISAVTRAIMIASSCCVFTCLGQRPAQNPVSQTRYTPAGLGYELVWEDQFNGTALDPKKWEVRGVGPRNLGYVSPEAVKVEGGFLKLSALKKDGRILLGAVGTQNHYQTKYGYFECRAQLQKSPGIWSAFWIQSPRISDGEDPGVYGAEIDIMEFFKKLGPDIVSHNVHWAYGPHQQTTHGMQSYRPGVSEGFHDFAVEWTPEKYVFFVDGYKYYEVTTGLSHLEEYLILSMEIPSEVKEINDTVFPDVFIVDYVKVYQKKPKHGEKKTD